MRATMLLRVGCATAGLSAIVFAGLGLPTWSFFAGLGIAGGLVAAVCVGRRAGVVSSVALLVIGAGTVRAVTATAPMVALQLVGASLSLCVFLLLSRELVDEVRIDTRVAIRIVSLSTGATSALALVSLVAIPRGQVPLLLGLVASGGAYWIALPAWSLRHSSAVANDDRWRSSGAESGR